MLEALLAATATSGLFALARGQRRSLTTDERVVEYAVSELSDEDLPCPWCYSQTAEGDTRCRSCGRKFG
ncbi:MAG: hypothetical protein ACR2ME_04695 [Acidimicrobiia bacterium]